MSDQEFSFTDAPSDAQGASATTEQKPYSDMGWEEFGRKTLSNVPSDAWETVTALPKAIYNYKDTAKGIYGVGKGIASKLSDVPLIATYDNAGNEKQVVPSVRTLVGGEQRTPEEKAQIEAPAEAFGKGLVEPLTSKEAFLRTVAEHPVSTAATLSIPVTGMGGALIKGGEALGEASTIGRAVGNIGQGVKTVGQAMDPTNAAIAGAQKAGEVAKTVVPGVQATFTGAPHSAFARAFDAGRLSGPAGEAARADFTSYLNGTGTAADFSKSVNDAFAKLKKAETDKWLAEKGAITGVTTTPIGFDPVFHKFDELRAHYGDRTPVGEYAHPDAHEALDEAQNAVMAYATSKNAADHTIVGFDKLKQALYDMAESKGDPEAKRAVMGVWQSVRDQITGKSPEYDDLMQKYQDLQSQLKDFNKTLGAGASNVAQNAQLARTLRAASTPQKQHLLDRLVEIDPSIAYKVAGASLHDVTPTGRIQQWIETGGGLHWGYQALRALAHGEPLTAATAGAAAVGQAALQSPKLMAKANEMTGAGVRHFSPVVGPPVAAAKIAAPVAAAANAANERGRDAVQFSDQPFEFTDNPGASGGMKTGGRVGRKAGGRIQSNPISEEVKRVRTLLSHRTATMLSMPDDAVATALNIAKGQQ